MITDVAAYPDYKDSRNESLGLVPSHWELIQLGRFGRFIRGAGGTKDDDAPEGIPCIRYGDLYTRHRFFILTSRSYVTPERAHDYTPVRHGDVLFAASGETLGEIGKSAVNLINGEVRCGGDLLVFRPNREVIPRFLGYVSDCPQSVNQKACMGRGVTVMHIYENQLKYLLVALPPLAEQAAIVRYLDYADRRIQRLIRGKQQLIRLLEEQRLASITQVVTRGLDENAPTKDAAVTWLGRVPRHWEEVRAKYLFREVDERSTHGVEELLSVSHITGVTPRSEKTITMFMASSYVGHKLCQPGDLVINTMWAWMGALGVSRHSGLVSPAYGVYRPLPTSRLVGGYAELLLKTKPYKAEYLCRSTGIRSSRLRLYPEQFLRIKIVCPPTREQEQILRWVQDETATTEQALLAAHREISLLSEYRKRLISDVITGKRDVREAAAHLSAEDDREEFAEEDLLLSDDELGFGPEELDEVAEESFA